MTTPTARWQLFQAPFLVVPREVIESMPPHWKLTLSGLLYDLEVERGAELEGRTYAVTERDAKGKFTGRKSK